MASVLNLRHENCHNLMHVPNTLIELFCLFCSGLGQAISTTAKTYATNTQNHVVTNLPKRLWRWVSWKLEKRLPFLDHQTTRSLASSIVNALTANEIPSIPDAIRDIQNADHRLDAEIWFCNIFQKTKTIILEDQSLAEDDVKGSWWSYLRPLWRILKTFEKNNRDDAAQRRTTRRRGRGLRLFSLLPFTAFHHRFILIDTDTLYVFFGRINWMGLVRPTKVDFDENAKEWWRMAFRLERVETRTRRFGFSIATDGTNVSVHLKKETPEWDGVNSHGFDKDGNYHPIQVGNRVVGLDPGRRDLFCAVYGDQRRQAVSCNTKEWYSMAGFTRARKKRETWIKKSGDLRNLLRGM